MKDIKIIALCMAVVLSAACEAEKLDSLGQSHLPSMQTVSISAGIANDAASTKTYIGGDPEVVDGKTFRKVYWSEGDKIGVVCMVGNQYIWDEGGSIKFFEFTLQPGGVGTENGIFVGQIPEEATIGDDAIYPYGSNGDKNVEQTATPNSFDPKASNMIATRVDGKLVFSHEVAYLKITTDEEYSRISVELDIFGTPTKYSLIPATSGGTIAVGTYYLAVFPVTDFSFTINGFTMTFEKGAKTYTKSTTKTLTLESGKIVNLGTIKFNSLTLITPLINLSEDGTANCYIVSEKGHYKFYSNKGNSTTSVGEVASVEVLWETFGTDITPAVGDLVKNVRYENGNILFEATSAKGNASIAAKDSAGNILWSWHIWMTDKPEDQVYYNNAGIIMDRNLGATSATPGDIKALGLLYQWGRKDPFLGSSSISNSTQAASTLTWPTAVTSDSSNGTIVYAKEHPTTFIKSNSYNEDWFYSGDITTDNTLWQSTKTIYDPCPIGYRVPDGGINGIWRNAAVVSNKEPSFNNNNKGFDLKDVFGDASSIWYPMTGALDGSSGQLHYVGEYGIYSSITPYENYAYTLILRTFNIDLYRGYSVHSNGLSIRCCKE